MLGAFLHEATIKIIQRYESAPSDSTDHGKAKKVREEAAAMATSLVATVASAKTKYFLHNSRTVIASNPKLNKSDLSYQAFLDETEKLSEPKTAARLKAQGLPDLQRFAERFVSITTPFLTAIDGERPVDTKDLLKSLRALLVSAHFNEDSDFASRK